MTLIQLPPLTELSYEVPLIWDSTMLVSFRKCRRYFFNTYMNHLRGGAPQIDGGKPQPAIPLHFGGTFAHGMETYRKHYFAEGASSAFMAAADAMILFWGDHPSQLLHNGKPDKRTLDRCIHALDQYFVQWPMESDLLQPHINADGTPTFEYSFSIPLDADHFPRHPSGAPFVVTGRLDQLGTYDGLPCWSDEKTTVSMGPQWAKQWIGRHQFGLYGWALRRLKFRARHVIVRGICIRENETAFDQTPPITVQEDWIDRIEQEIAQTLSECVTFSQYRSFPRDFGDGCFSHWRQCPFWECCSTRDEVEFAYLKAMNRAMWDPLRIHGSEDEE